jgi:hypothetical protein
MYNAQEEAKMKFSCKKKRKENVVYVNGGRVIAIVSI